MARILDPNVDPTYVAQVNQKSLDDALQLLQVRGAGGLFTERVFAAAIVAIVKHLERLGAFEVPDGAPEKPPQKAPKKAKR